MTLIYNIARACKRNKTVGNGLGLNEVVEMEFVGIIYINFSFKKFVKKGRLKLG